MEQKKKECVMEKISLLCIIVVIFSLNGNKQRCVPHILITVYIYTHIYKYIYIHKQIYLLDTLTHIEM